MDVSGYDVEDAVQYLDPVPLLLQVRRLAAAGVPVRIDDKYAIMHSKYVEVDGQTVELGSFNFTEAAEARNAESLVVLHDQAVAAEFERNWQSLWNESSDYGVAEAP